MLEQSSGLQARMPGGGYCSRFHWIWGSPENSPKIGSNGGSCKCWGLSLDKNQ